jgi:hypothetical protein
MAFVGHVFLKLPHYSAADVDEIIERKKGKRKAPDSFPVHLEYISNADCIRIDR